MSSRTSIHTAPPHSNPGTNPFTTPLRQSRAPSVSDGHSGSGRAQSSSYFPAQGVTEFPQPRRRKFKSARLTPGEYDEKPWAVAKHPKLKWERTIFYGSIGLGVAIGAFICYRAFASVTNHTVSFILHGASALADMCSTAW